MDNDISRINEEKDLHELFKLWEQRYVQQNFDPEPIVRRIAEILEEEAEYYMRKDPDPFDERHPSRIDPESSLGKNLKLIFKKEQFMNRLVNDYLRDNFFTRQSLDKSSTPLNIAACRLILIIMPGLETSAVFQVSNDQLINRLYDWVEKAEEPLRSYATGLLGAAMELQEITVAFREQNIRMLPLLLNRLRTLQTQYKTVGNISCLTNGPKSDSPERPFKHLGRAATNDAVKNGSTSTQNLDESFLSAENSQSTQDRTPKKFLIPLHPPTLATSQMMILRYLTPMGEYQEFLPFIFEGNAMEIIFGFLETIDSTNTCLVFEALKYLASLLCHKKCCIEFLSRNGLSKLLQLPRQSTIATGIAIALYYIAYCEEAMERICSLPPRMISDLVKYALGLLGCNHDSGRCHATMFFGLTFQFKVMLDEFDKQDGLRKLYNVISVLSILMNPSDDDDLTLDDQNAQRQVIRHVCVTLKKYFESHLFYKYTSATKAPNTRISSPSRALKNPQEIINDQILTLQGILPMKSNWLPVTEFLNLGGITLFILVIAHSYEWNYSGRGETVRSALDVLNMCCVVPKVHSVFCDRVEFPGEANTAGISIILGAAEGEIVADPEVQKSALSLLVNCVCAPIHRPSGGVARVGSAKKKLVDKNSEEIIKKLWETVRANNGIIVLLQLMMIKTPITDADCIRGMACRSLAGLARSETVRQIVGKLPLFVNGQLQQLMRDPILQEKRFEHVQFQKYALELLERVTGKAINVDTSLANIHKANVVAQTKIQFNEQQLHLLIYQHLLEKGLTTTAETLMKEAKLTQTIFQQRPPNGSQNNFSPFIFRSPMVQRTRIRQRLPDSLGLDTSLTEAAGTSKEIVKMDEDSESLAAITTPIKLIKKNPPPTPTSSSLLEKQHNPEEPFMTANKNPDANVPNSNVTLNTIITEYLTNQHSLCKNPMSTCPQFDLFQPHKCPDPRPNRNVMGNSANVAARFFKRHQGFNSFRHDRRFVHSHFHVARILKLADSETCFTTCDFTPDASSLMIGTHNGEVRVFHINDSTEDFSATCSDSYINNIKCSRDGRLVLTSSTWHKPLSVLWSVDNKAFHSKFNFEDEEYVEFSNLVQDKALGTQNEKATIYDLKTGHVIRALTPTIMNQYNKNRATFCPTDELILSDGVLWDVRSSQQIHKFDKLNNTVSGVFHPNGLEVVSNTEVWDLRTFHLLRTIPALDQCQVKFSPLNVMYAYSIQAETIEEDHSYDTSFKVLDSYDYTSISTTDVRKSIYDLAINSNGCQIALCENQGVYDSLSESVVRVYTVGRKRDPEDDPEEEDDDEMGSDEEDGMDDESENGEGNGGFEREDVRRRRRRINLNQVNLENMFDIASLTTEDSESEDDFDSNSSNENSGMETDGEDLDIDIEGNDEEEGGWETTSENGD